MLSTLHSPIVSKRYSSSVLVLHYLAFVRIPVHCHPCVPCCLLSTLHSPIVSKRYSSSVLVLHYLAFVSIPVYCHPCVLCCLLHALLHHIQVIQQHARRCGCYMFAPLDVAGFGRCTSLCLLLYTWLSVGLCMWVCMRACAASRPVRSRR